MPGRTFNPTDYRYGFDGMEKDDEIKGSGNIYTTHFRGYDARLGRWFSTDPEEKAQPYQSPYCAMDNNPIKNTDPLGDCVICDWNQAIGDGVISGVSSMLSGIGDIISHPDVVLNDLTYAADHLAQTGSNIKAGLTQYADDLTSGDSKRSGNAIGEGIAFVGSFFVGGEAAKAVTTAVKVEKAEVVIAKTVATSEKTAVKTTEKLSKVSKSKTTESIGGKYTKTTEVKPGKGPGQSRADYVKYKNADGKTIKMHKDSYDRANKFQHRKAKL